LKLDADDELLPGHLDALEKAFESDAEIGMVFASVFTKSEANDIKKTEYITDKDQIISAAQFRKKLLECFLYRMPGCALRREITLGKELPDPSLFQIHDWEYFLRITYGSKAKLLHNHSVVNSELLSSGRQSCFPMLKKISSTLCQINCKTYKGADLI
jgi:hypothetical protein